jgi:hypothetical protein
MAEAEAGLGMATEELLKKTLARREQIWQE